MYDEIMQRIRTLIPEESKAQEVFNLLSEEVFDNLFAQLADVSTDEEMKVYETRLNESKSPEHLQTMMNEIAITVYGDNYAEELKKDFITMLDEIEKEIQAAKDLINKAQQGDPTANDLLKKAQQTDTFKNIMEE